MQRLEASLDTRLLTRSNQAFRLTESGQLLAARARTIQHEWQQGVQELGQFQQEPSGTVRISASVAFARTLLLPLLPELHQRYPKVVLDLQLDDQIADLGAVDLSIRIGLVEEQGVIARPISPLHLKYGVSRSFLTHHALPKTPEDLTELPVIGFRLPSSGRLMPWQFQRTTGPLQQHSEIYTLELNPVAVVNEPQAILDLIMADMGVGLINTYMTQRLINRGELVVVLEDFMPPNERAIYLCYQSREHMPLKQRVVIDFLLMRCGTP